MNFIVVLKSLKAANERIVLDSATSIKHAEQQRKNWRRVLGSKNWAVDRRPGLDTLDHLALTIEKVEHSGSIQCPHCHWGFDPSVIDQHIREKH